jgi:cytochrome c553
MKLGLLLVLICLILNQVHAAGDPQSGSQKALLCSECHGFDGFTPDPIIPRLNGQDQDFLKRQIAMYQNGQRFDSVMNEVLEKVKLKDADIEDITAFYASLPRMSDRKPLTDDGLRGKQVFRQKNCLFCHNDYDLNQDIMIAKTAVIGGQNRDYLFKSLKDIQQGTRRADEFNLMQRVLKQMSDDDIYAVSEFLSSL